MQPFVAQPLIKQSGDATTIIIVDNSNYSTNTDGVTAAAVLSRSVAVTDASGNPVATVLLTLQTDGSYSGTLPVTKDYYYAYLLTITLPGSVTKTGTTTYVSVQYYNNTLIAIVQNNQGDCGCCDSGSLCTNLFWAMHNYNAAIILAAKAMGLLSQQSIDAANTFLNTILNG